MRKLHLTLDDLRVDSFDTSPAERARRGTVHGQVVDVAQPYSQLQQCGSYPNCPSPLCVDTPMASCDNASCRWTCGDSCNGSCQSCATCNTCQESCNGTCGACIPPDPMRY